MMFFWEFQSNSIYVLYTYQLILQILLSKINTNTAKFWDEGIFYGEGEEGLDLE